MIRPVLRSAQTSNFRREGTPRWSRRGYAIGAGLIVVMAAASLIAIGSRVRRADAAALNLQGELNELVLAAGTQRAFEPRLTGGFAYGAVLPVSSHAPPTRSLRSAIRRALNVVDARARDERDGGRSLQVRGIASLMDGRAADAIADIEIALMRAPDRGDWWSDLAAAYLVRAGDMKSPEDIVRALDAARRAVEAAPSSPEPRFNLALALEASHLLDAAGHAWTAYLDIDAASPWAAEAVTRRTAVELRRSQAANPSERPCSQIARWLWDEELAGIADRLRHRDRKAADARLAEARQRGAGCAGDRVFLDAVLDHVVRCQTAMSCEDLAAGAAALAEGSRLEREDRGTRAQETFDEAARRLAQAGSPATLVAEIDGATAAIRRGDAKAGREQLIVLAERVRRAGYHGLAGQAWLQVVNATGGFDRLDEALTLSRRAFDEFTAAGDPALLASGHNLMAAFLSLAGARPRAWDHRLAALALYTGTSADGNRRVSSLLGAARMAMREQLDGAATAYHEAALASVEGRGTSADVVEVRIALAQSYARLGAGARALNAIGPGLVGLDPGIDGRLRAALDARLAAVEAALATPEVPAQAIARITDAIGYHERVDDVRRLPELLLVRARAHRSAGDTEQARQDLLRAAALLEGGVRAAGDDAYAYFENGWQLYAELVRIETLIGGDARAGLFAAERILLAPDVREQYANGLALPTRVLAADEAIVRYLCLDERWLAWVIDRDGFELVQHDVAESELTYQSQRLVDLMERHGSDEQVDATLTWLHRRLIAPLPDRARRAKRLIVVADGPLLRVPFPALRDAGRQRFLIEDYTITRARSALDLLARRASLAESGVPARRPQARALVIGNPALDRALWAALPALPASEAEAKAIGRIYADATVLTGAAATPSDVRRAVEARDVVHFGGHAIERARRGDIALVLAPETAAGASSGVLPLESLLGSGPVKPRVIVLAACRSGTGPQRRAAGLTGLPELLLGKGVDDVVASLWNVEDLGTQQLMVPFHLAIADGVDAADALRRAQLALVHESDEARRRPAVWGSFVVASRR